MPYVMTSGFSGMGSPVQGFGVVALAPIAISSAMSIASSILIGPITRLIKGCGPSCVMTSSWANQAESTLRQNLKAYMDLPTPRPKSAQTAFLQNFDAVWGHLVQQCGQVSGAAGANCIGDRQEGACHFKDNGQCWNWFVGYRDPIANDKNVAPDATFADELASVFGGGSAGSSNLLPLALIAGLVVLGVSL